MNVRLLSLLALGASGLALAAPARADQITLFDGKKIASLVHDGDRPIVLASAMLASDLAKLSGMTPTEGMKLEDCAQLCIVIAQRGSPLLDAVAKDTSIDLAQLQGKWERYARVAISSRRDPARRYLVIAGSDTRGAIWGTVDLTRELGVSAWEWWADVAPRKASTLAVDGGFRLSQAPSIKYRGIFLNDEDWGLQPWAAKTFEPETGDIGPKTYARIFELMWRLKANLIWPAMHDSTKPFYQIAGNAQMAKDYDIVVGTSHAEPMMRNNVREWDEAKQGPFNFFTNRDTMIRYWQDRATEVKPFENIYTVGLRGKHDSEMEGAASPEIARDTLAQVIGIQRELLSKTQGRPATQVPQALTLYKEVLELYSLGLKVPDDVTLVWPEDNYGYINQLSNTQERARSGGSGVYYHISYWGRPHDYLWLATTHPALIREQMERAWQMDARKIWMLNVGDIKPGEYLTQYFLDLAFDHNQLKPSAQQHLRTWLSGQFDAGVSGLISEILTEYYDLAFERRPEFMGFSQVEPITLIRISDYVRTGGDEAERRIERYQVLAAKAQDLAARIPADRKDAYFQLVLYPVRAAASLNERNLKLDLAALYGRQGRPAANALVQQARSAHEQIVADTETYNQQSGGKWKGIMSMAPRQLPVFEMPPFPTAEFTPKSGCAVDASRLQFVKGRPAIHPLTVYSWGEAARWQASGVRGLTLSASSGQLLAGSEFEQRISVSYDGKAASASGSILCGAQKIDLESRIAQSSGPASPVEIDRTISLLAAAPSTSSPDWERVEGLGSRQAALRSSLGITSRDRTDSAKPVVYAFETRDQADAELRVVALPVHPLTSANRLRLAVQIDDEPVQYLDFETHGRSEEWKLNVLSNMAQRRIALPQLTKGKHTLKVYALDPGFLLDRIDVRLNGAPDFYGAPPTF